jgi:hypothetical protein
MQGLLVMLGYPHVEANAEHFLRVSGLAENPSGFGGGERVVLQAFERIDSC